MKKLSGALTILSFIMLMGTIGGIECGTIEFNRGLSLILIFMATFLMGGLTCQK